jgi:hypothetical protein
VETEGSRRQSFDPTPHLKEQGLSIKEDLFMGRQEPNAVRRGVAMDLDKFFDRTNHDIVKAREARRVKDKNLPLN